MTPQDTLDTVALFVRAFAAGRLSAAQLNVVGQQLLPWSNEPPSRAELRRAVDRFDEHLLIDLRKTLFSAHLEDAALSYRLRSQGRPMSVVLARNLADLPALPALGWSRLGDAVALLKEVLQLLVDCRFAHSRSATLTTGVGVVEQAFLTRCHQLGATPGLLALLQPAEICRVVAGMLSGSAGSCSLATLAARLATDAQRCAEAFAATATLPSGEIGRCLDERQALDLMASRLLRIGDHAELQQQLDVVLLWPTDAASRVIPTTCQRSWQRERAALVFAMRFGHAAPYESWVQRLLDVARRREADEQMIDTLRGERPVDLLAVYLACSTIVVEPEVDAELTELARASTDGLASADFVSRWRGRIVAAELQALSVERPTRIRPASTPDEVLVIPIASSPVDQSCPPPVQPTAAPVLPAELAPALALAAPIEIRKRPPPVWAQRLQGFVSTNWYLALGVMMVVVGASVLAYYTWDKHWLIRYTLTPVLLAAFTGWLARLGRWLERADATLKSASMLLHGAAIALLPVNFMAVALLADDPQVPHKAIVTPLMALAYIVASGAGVRRWSRTAHEALPALLVPSILVLNCLVLLAPLSHATSLAATAITHVLVVGFYCGFAMVAVTASRFVGRTVTWDVARNKTVATFFGATLLVTYLEVFLWVHGYLRVAPQVYTYAPLVVLVGGLVFFLEQRFLRLHRETARHVESSFLGFALVGIGVLMALPEPHLRVLCFALAGSVWLYQASHRGQPVHHWIGLILLSFAAMSVYALPFFPGSFAAVIGLVLAWLLYLVATMSRSERWADLGNAAHGMMFTTLALTAAVAMVAQWHFQSSPILTAVVLAIVAATLFVSALRDNNLRVLHTALLLLPFALPYMGLGDLARGTVAGNTMALGLGALGLAWAALLWIRPQPLLVKTRSTVLFYYGVLGIAALLMRFVNDGDGLSGHGALHDAVDLAAILLLVVNFTLATFYTRSWLGVAMAAVVSIMALTAIKAALVKMWPHLTWGSGIGSALGSAALVAVAFPLRRSRTLSEAGPLDLWLGRERFPFTRRDPTLVTTPALVLAGILVFYVTVVKLLLALDVGVLPLKTAAALALTSITYAAVAVFLREHGVARLFVHAAWVSFLAGACAFSLSLTGSLTQWPLVATFVLLRAAVLASRHAAMQRAPFAGELLAIPLARILRIGTYSFAIGLTCALVTGLPLVSVWALVIVLLAELAGVALGDRVLLAGSLFAGLTVVVAAIINPWPDTLAIALTGVTSIPALAALVCLVVGARFLCVRRANVSARLRPLLQPLSLAATGLAIALGLGALLLVLSQPLAGLALAALWGLAAVLLLAIALCAWVERSVALVVLAALLVFALAPVLLAPGGAASVAQRWGSYYGASWYLGLFALCMAALNLSARRHGFWASVPAATAWAQVRQRERDLAAAAGLASAALTLVLAAEPGAQVEISQIIGPLLAAAAFGLMAWGHGLPVLYYAMWLAGAELTVIVVHHHLRSVLFSIGASEPHVVAVGLGIGLLLTGATARLLRVSAARRSAAYFCAFGATAILLLLTAHFVSSPDLAEATAGRFVLSGALSLLAGAYCRGIAMHVPAGSWQRLALRGMWHLGLVVALWCWALVVPPLRTPATAFFALAVPFVYFYLRAERDHAALDQRETAAILGLVLLALYPLHGLAQLIVFPEASASASQLAYHTSAPVILLVSLVLFRLHGLGASPWLAFYGGLGFIVSLFFGITAIPPISPFRAPLAAALVAALLAHALTVAGQRPWLGRRFLCRIGNLSEERWHELCRPWGLLLLGGVSVATAWVLSVGPHGLIAPAIVAGATVLLHHGLIARRPAYLHAAIIAIIVALEVSSTGSALLPSHYVGLGLLLLWGLVIAAQPLLRKFYNVRSIGLVSALIFGLVSIHVGFSDFSSRLGLVQLAALAALGGLAVRSVHDPRMLQQSVARWLWHLGMTVAIVCAALLLPPLRTPMALGVVAALPALYFYARAELGWGAVRDHHRPAAILVLVWLVAYASAPLIALVVAGASSEALYSQYAPLALGLSLALLRLGAICGSVRLRLVAGGALMTAMVVVLWGLDVLNPWGPDASFAPYGNAFVGVALTHLLTVMAVQPSILRDTLLRVAGASEATWQRLCRWWGLMALGGLHLLAIWALVDGPQRYLAAPLLVLVASVVLHHGRVARRAAYGYLGVLELLAAVHVGFVFNAPLIMSLHQAALVTMLLWAVLLLMHRRLMTWFGLVQAAPIWAACFALGVLHIMGEGATTTTGLVLAAIMALLLAMTPVTSAARHRVPAAAATILVLAAPLYLAVAGQWHALSLGITSPQATWPLVYLAVVLVVLGFAAEFMQRRLLASPVAQAQWDERIIGRAVELIGQHGRRLQFVLLTASTLVTLVVVPLRGQVAFTRVCLATLLILLASFIVAWIREGRARDRALFYFVAELCLGAVFGVARQFVVLTYPGLWLPEYDVYAELVTILAAAGVKELLPLERSTLLPVVTTLIGLPLGALAFVVSNHLGANVALLVLGVNSIAMAFVGRDHRTSVYNIMAILGFVTFVLVAFRGKFALDEVHAYVIPVSLGTLGLTHLLKDSMGPRTRTRVRWLAVLAMLGSAGYYAILGGRAPIAYHAIFLFLGLLAAVAGSLLRVRLYLLLGATAVVVDLASLVARTIIMMDRTAQMTAFGVLVLVVGVAVVAGAVYFKANRDKLMGQLEAWQKRLYVWE